MPVHDGGQGSEADTREDSPANVMIEVFTGQYPSLVRLAAMLLDDSHAAEDVVQDAYVRVAARHYRLRDPHKALAYLRQTVVNLARNSLRHRFTVGFQDGASWGFFKKVGSGPWQAQEGGEPVVCLEVLLFPRAVLTAWSLPTDRHSGFRVLTAWAGRSCPAAPRSI